MLAFAPIISALKPKDRTDQYKVLAALYCLEAHVRPATTAQVSDLLKLHLGTNVPANINTCLRRYNAYVEAADKGPPLKWSLTSGGLEHLRMLSGLALTVAKTEADFGVDIGFVCALEHPEFAAVTAALGGPQSWKDVGDTRFTHLYRQAELVTNNGKRLKAVGTTSTSMGLTAAAIATTQMILQFRPRIVVMVGIAAGTRSGNKQFGDVLVADPSVDYNSGKVVQENGIREFQPDPYPIGLNPRLRSVLLKYKGNPRVFTKIRDRWKGAMPGQPNKLHVGPVGAADQVIDDASRVLEIQKNWRKLIGVEMETYGVYRACYESPEPKPRVVSFKSVCDFAAAKVDSWQEYAAFVAAEFAVDFLKSEWDALWPTA
jgi:nucleoside phosphorylase